MKTAILACWPEPMLPQPAARPAPPSPMASSVARSASSNASDEVRALIAGASASLGLTWLAACALASNLPGIAIATIVLIAAALSLRSPHGNAARSKSSAA